MGKVFGGAVEGIDVYPRPLGQRDEVRDGLGRLVILKGDGDVPLGR